DVGERGTSNGEACTPDVGCPGATCGAVAVFTNRDGGNVLQLFRARDATTETVACTGHSCTLPPGTPDPYVLHNVADSAVPGNIAAFQVAEAGAVDLNQDGDTQDIVMFAYDLKSRRVFSTVMASRQCQVAGCDPGLPYKIRDGAV